MERALDCADIDGRSSHSPHPCDDMRGLRDRGRRRLCVLGRAQCLDELQKTPAPPGRTTVGSYGAPPTGTLSWPPEREDASQLTQRGRA